MKIHHWIVFILLFGFTLSGCDQSSTAPTVTVGIKDPETPTATVEVPSPVPPTATPIPDPEEIVQTFLESWKAEDYSEMYTMLSAISRDAISEEDFIFWYQDTLARAAVGEIDYEILSSFTPTETSAQVNFRVILHSVLVGDIVRDTLVNLSLANGGWKVEYADNLILPELAGGNYLWMDRVIPPRGNIYDRNGEILVGYDEAVSIGLIPAQINPETERDLFADVQRLTGLHPDAIRYLYRDFPPGAEWYLALGEETFEHVQKYYDVSNGYNYNGLLMYPFESRFYYENGVASQAIGYVSYIQADEEQEYLKKGYSRDEKIGRQGIEKWGEEYLTGTRGGTLYVIGPDDQVVTQLANVSAQPAQTLQTTIDKDLQLAAETMLQKFSGAIVVMEVDTGRVLVMASSPHFDPNAFEPTNANSSYQLQEYFDTFGGQPMLNRAALGQYPLGSVFKIITMAAALESGLYTPNSSYYCSYHFEEIPSIARRDDWTWDHCQEELATDGECETQPSGELNLVEGLMRSCNPYFWHIGLDLYRQGLTDAISGMARGFGLGSPTGIVGITEEDGNIPEPGDEVAAINHAIGQGDTLVTPLQVAQFIAAIGNGGTIYQPQIIQEVSPPGGDPTYSFEPIVSGELPVSPETLDAIQRGMVKVVEDRRGTARHVLASFSQNLYSLAGKTGTAETGFENSHAWFAGYTRENRESKPDIAIAVIAEFSGEGSEIAAPIFRGIVQYYFEGRRGYVLPWEWQVGVIALPEPEEIEEND